MMKKIDLVYNKISVLLVILIVIFNFIMFTSDECNVDGNNIECKCICHSDVSWISNKVEVFLCYLSLFLPQEQYIIQKDFVKSIFNPPRI